MKNRVFAKGLSFWKLFLFFVIGCIFGTFFEEILFYVQYGSYSSRSGVLYGPFSPLYGFGVVMYLILLGKDNENRGIIKTFLFATFIGGIVEYVVSFLVELFFQIRFWDYSNMFLNIHGRTTIPFMLAWGLFGTILLKIIYPYFSNWIEKIPFKIGMIFSFILLLFFLFDMSLTFSVFLRMRARNQGELPKNYIEEVYDRIYPNEYMYQRFPMLNGKI